MPHDEFGLTRKSIFTIESWCADVRQNIHTDYHLKINDNGTFCGIAGGKSFSER